MKCKRCGDSGIIVPPDSFDAAHNDNYCWCDAGKKQNPKKKPIDVSAKLDELSAAIDKLSPDQLAEMFTDHKDAAEYATLERLICGGFVVKYAECRDCGCKVIAQPIAGYYRWFCSNSKCRHHKGNDSIDMPYWGKYDA